MKCYVTRYYKSTDWLLEIRGMDMQYYMVDGKLYVDTSKGDYTGLSYEGGELVLYVSNENQLPEYETRNSVSENDICIVVEYTDYKNYDKYVDRCLKYGVSPQSREWVNEVHDKISDLIELYNRPHIDMEVVDSLIQNIKGNLLHIDLE